MTTRPDLSRSHPLGIRRDGAMLTSYKPGNPSTRWSQHAKIDHGQTHLPARYLALRDSMPGSSHVMDALRKHVPRAAQIVDAFMAGECNTRAEAIKADEDYKDLLKNWRASYLGSKAAMSAMRTDADAVWLHAETVHVLARVLEMRYAEPTIFNVIPTEVLGTVLTSYEQFQKIMTDEDAVLGDTFEPTGAGGADAERGSILRQLRFYKKSVGWTERDLEIEAAVRANNPGLAWSLVADRMDGAQRAMDRMRANIAAFGQLKTAGLDGLLYGSAPATAATESEFAGATPETNVNNLLNLVAGQSTDVNFQNDRVADTLAMDPASYAHLARQMWTDGVTTPGESALENFMRRAPTIKQVVVVSEFRSTGAAAIAKILPKVGGDSTMAARLSGGMRISGEQRSVAMAYCDNADVFAHVVGRQLEVRTWPEHRGHFNTVMRESSGGVVCFEPKGLKMIYRPEDGDRALS